MGQPVGVQIPSLAPAPSFSPIPNLNFPFKILTGRDFECDLKGDGNFFFSTDRLFILAKRKKARLYGPGLLFSFPGGIKSRPGGLLKSPFLPQSSWSEPIDVKVNIYILVCVGSPLTCNTGEPDCHLPSSRNLRDTLDS